MTIPKKIDKLQAEGFALYTITTALAMRDPYTKKVSDNMRKLKRIKERLEKLEASL